jgi:hypothetical protein
MEIRFSYWIQPAFSAGMTGVNLESNPVARGTFYSKRASTLWEKCTYIAGRLAGISVSAIQSAGPPTFQSYLFRGHALLVK